MENKAIYKIQLRYKIYYNIIIINEEVNSYKLNEHDYLNSSMHRRMLKGFSVGCQKLTVKTSEYACRERGNTNRQIMSLLICTNHINFLAYFLTQIRA